MNGKKLKAEKREKKSLKAKKFNKKSGTLAGQVKRMQINKSYRGDVKKF
ncbi:MAG: hypothetical protein WC310_00955 [Patescibacteria group bacterium]|jgi:hypothetical protein